MHVILLQNKRLQTYFADVLFTHITWASESLRIFLSKLHYVFGYKSWLIKFYLAALFEYLYSLSGME